MFFVRKLRRCLENIAVDCQNATTGESFSVRSYRSVNRFWFKPVYLIVMGNSTDRVPKSELLRAAVMGVDSHLEMDHAGALMTVSGLSLSGLIQLRDRPTKELDKKIVVKIMSDGIGTFAKRHDVYPNITNKEREGGANPQ